MSGSSHSALPGALDAQFNTPPQTQDEMTQNCEDEIAHNTWNFNPSVISQMLSPKTLKDNIRPQAVECFEDARKYCDFLVDKPFFPHALQNAVDSLPPTNWPEKKIPERDYYPPLVKFLNDCIERCNSALDAHSRLYEGVPERRLYKVLQFVKYDRYMLDGVDGARQLKPDCGAGHKLQQGDRLCWSAKCGSSKDVKVIVEVKASWADLLQQAASYARCEFRASPTRSWSLVLGFNQAEKKSLRFLIFHRGGCTASTDMELGSKLGRKEACRLILTMLLWTEDYHDGFCCFSTDEEYAIPDPERKSMVDARVQKNLYQMTAICTRGTLVSIVSVPESKHSTTTTPPTQITSPTSPTSPTSLIHITSPTSPSQTTSPDLRPAARTLRRSARLIAQDTNKAGSKRQSDTQKATSRKKPREDSSHPQADDSLPTETVSPGGSQDRSIAKGIQVHYLGSKSSSPPCGSLLLKFCWPDDGHGSVEGEFLSSSSGAFGTPSHIVSYKMLDPSGLVVSNRIFLPSKEKSEYEGAWWNVWTKQYTVQQPNYRDVTCHLFGALGSSLLDAPSSWSLLESISHALVGWLSYYQNGYMHRDVSIGNVLRLDTGLEMDAIKIRDPFSGQDEYSLELTKAIADTRSHVNEIKDLLEKLGISSECKGILIDGDMAANWTTYFDNDHSTHSLSGTDEFMSINLLQAMLKGRRYMQSPVDDMHSFFWVTLWAVLFNSHNEGQDSRSLTEISCRDDWTKNPMAKAGILMELQTIKASGQTPSLLAGQMLKFLQKWFSQVDQLEIEWLRSHNQRVKSQKIDRDKEWFTVHFHLYAYRGICESLRLILQYREELMKHGPFKLQA